MGHNDPQIMVNRITATLWNWRRLGNDQDSTSRGNNPKGGYEKSYVANAHNLDTWPEAARKGDEPKPFHAHARNWQPTKKVTPWESRPKIREIKIEQESQESGSDECPQ